MSTMDTPTSAKSESRRRHRGWLAGAGMVLVGLLFLLRNFGVDLPLPQNWWAVFILLSAVGSFWKARHTYQEDKRLSHAVRGQLMGGLMTGLVAVIFLFGLDWGKVWPLFLILGGLSALIYPREKPRM